MGGVILSFIFFLITCFVSYKAGYFKKVYFKITGTEVPAEDRPDYWAVRSWSRSIEKLHLNADAVFFGNSITAGSNFETLFAADSLCIVELGYAGDNIEGMIRRMDMLQSCRPKKVFLMAGINGLKDQTIDEFQYLYANLVDSIIARNSGTDLYLQSILPVNPEYAKPDMSRNFASNNKIIIANSIIKQIAQNKNCTYIDLHHLYYENGMMAERYTRDGVHLKPDAYKLWADAIHEYLIEE